MQDLINALREKYTRWQAINVDDIYEMNHLAFKKRFEIREDKIRALYGHSGDVKIVKTQSAPPKYLYHGTSPRNAEQILQDGLQAMERQYVHLSADRRTAWHVGKRKTDTPVILMIEALEANKNGVKFYYGNDTVWLADSIPANYIRRED